MRSLADFVGRWRLEREIEDFCNSGQLSQFSGAASFSTAADGLDYYETGVLRLGQAAGMKAERRYAWRASGGLIAVYFDDGRYFHAFDPAADETRALHNCDPDNYSVHYQFGDWPCWQATWNVRGPRKNYRMTSRFAPAGSRAGETA
ncbi:MAG: trigger factor [Rhodobacteraceae bacterium]|nr:trigger factor [Paracoccaceae bacterium]